MEKQKLVSIQGTTESRLKVILIYDIYIYIYIYIYIHTHTHNKNTCNDKHNNKFCCSVLSNVSTMKRKRNLLLVHPPTDLSVFLAPVN